MAQDEGARGPGPAGGPCVQRRLAAAYATYFIALGIQIPYLPLWFQQRGLGPEAIGIALAVPMLARLVATPLLGLLSDRLGRPRALLVALALATVLGMGALAASREAFAIFVVLGLMSLCWFPGLALLDSYASRLAKAKRADYGRARQWGSASFLVANVAGGAFIGGLGAGSVVLLMLAGHLTHVLATAALPELPPAERRAMPLNGRRARLGLLAGIVAGAVVQASHAPLYAFASVHWAQEGVSLTTIGLLWAAGVAAEMVLFRFGTGLVARFGPHRLIAAGGMAALVRFAAMAGDPPLELLFPLQLLHAFTFGATYLGTVELIARSVSEHRAGAGQTAAAWTTSLFMATANVASGPLWQQFGPMTFLAAGVVGLAGTGVALLAGWLQPHRSGAGG
ncbi:MFS transporter [Xanthobacter sp. AM11]|uniref:MFS transporter n=1 Tax=Xanthobacter sp. AM11 TaxID=3380643 RepID=UPI0039BFB2E1